MELVIILQELESLRKKNEDLVSEPLGFLNSEYKSLVTESLKNVSSKSIFGIRQRVKSRSYTTCCHSGIALKLSLFLIIILLIFN